MPANRNGDWVYFARLVPGYAGKWSLRGMRERNRRWLQRLLNADTETERLHFRNLLAENNQPLAMRVACNYGKTFDWPQDRILEEFQNGCLYLTEYLSRNDIPDNAAYLQVRLYMGLTSTLSNSLKTATFDNLAEMVPFHEEDFPVEGETKKVNKETLARFIRQLPYTGQNSPKQRLNHERNKEILLDWLFGDPVNYVCPFDADMISNRYDITRNMVWTIVHKMEQELKKYIHWSLNHTAYRREDFYL